MSDNTLTMSLNLDLKPFKDKLQGALQLGQEFSRQWQALASGLRVEADFSALERVFDEIAEELGDVADEADNAEKEVKELGDETEKTGKKGKKSGQDLLGVLSDLGNAYRGIRQAAMDAYEVLSMPVGKLVELQSGMSDTNTMLGLTKDQLAALTDELLKISVDWGIKDLTDLTKGYYDAVSNGRQELAFFNDAAAASRRGHATLTDSISFGVNALNAWSMATQESTRVFFAAYNGVNKGATTFTELAQNLGQVASTAAAAGISLEEVIAANATFTKAGNKTNTSMTYMRGAILALNKALGDGWKETMTFQEGLNKVAEMAGGSDKKLLELLGSQEAYAFTVALTGEKAAEAASDLASMYGDITAFDKALKEQTALTNLRFQLDKLVASFNRLMVKLTSDFSPIIGGVVSAVGSLFDFFAKYPAVISAVVTAFGTFIAVTKILKLRQIELNVVSAIGAALKKDWIALAAAAAAAAGVAALQMGILARKQKEYTEALKETNKVSNASKRVATEMTVAEVQDRINANTETRLDLEKELQKVGDDRRRAEIEFRIRDIDNDNKRLKKLLANQKEEIVTRKNLMADLEQYENGITARLQMNNLDRLTAELEDAKAYKESLGAITEENYNEHKEAAEKIIAIEHELAREKEAQLQELSGMEQEYRLAAISDEYERQIAEIEATRDAELKKAKILGASQETLKLIKDNYDAQARAVEEGHQQELEDARQDFDLRSLELSGNTYDAQMDAIDRHYEQRKAKLMAAGFSEQQIEEQKEAAKQRIRDNYNKRAVQGASKTLGDLAKAAKAFGKKGFAVWKRLAQIQAIVDTYSGATAAYKSMAGIPYVGPVLGAIAAAAAIAAGLANVAEINKQKFATGGFVKGKSHAQGGELIEVEGGEHVTRKSRVAALGRRIFDFLNNAPLAQVQAAIGNMMLPSIPVPATVGGRYADGGVVSSSLALNSLVGEIVALRGDMARVEVAIRESRSRTIVQFDPFTTDPVKVSEVAEEGDRQRSRI